MIRSLALGAALVALSGCTTSYEVCRGDPYCMSQRQQANSTMNLAIVSAMQNANRQPALFYAMPTNTFNNGPIRLQTTCSRIGTYTYCN